MDQQNWDEILKDEPNHAEAEQAAAILNASGQDVAAYGLYYFLCSLRIASWNYPFHSLLMAALLSASAADAAKIEAMWPELIDQWTRRRDTDEGKLQSENLSKEEWDELTRGIEALYPFKPSEEVINAAG